MNKPKLKLYSEHFIRLLARVFQRSFFQRFSSRNKSCFIVSLTATVCRRLFAINLIFTFTANSSAHQNLFTNQLTNNSPPFVYKNAEKNNHVIYRPWSVHLGKNCLGSWVRHRGRRPRAVLKALGTADLSCRKVNNIYAFFALYIHNL